MLLIPTYKPSSRLCTWFGYNNSSYVLLGYTHFQYKARRSIEVGHTPKNIYLYYEWLDKGELVRETITGL